MAVASVTPVLAPLQSRTFRLLWLGMLAANLGNLIQSVGAGWLMTTLTSSHAMVALVPASSTLPLMLFSIASGALADNLDRRNVMLLAQLGMTVVSALLAIAAFSGLLTPWTLLAFTFLLGCGMTLYNPSWQASVADMVPREHLSGAITLNAMGFNSMRSVGPAVGGVVVALSGAAAAFCLNAVLYLPLVLAIRQWRPEPKPDQLPREPLLSAMWVGIRYASLSPRHLTIMLRGCVFGFSAVVIVSLLPSVTSEQLAGNSTIYGTLLACFGLGAIGGGIVNNRLRARFSNEAIVRLGCLGFALSSIALGCSQHLFISHIALLPAGASWIIVVSLFNISIQLFSPRWVVGRSVSLYQTATFGGMTMGAATWGWAADIFGLTWAFMFAGVGLLLCALLGALFPLPQFQSSDLETSATPVETAAGIHAISVDVNVVITIDYTIDPQDVPTLLTLMADRRRFRLRDGVRDWTLLRDIERPDRWTESYRVTNWTEYLRHHARRTSADARNIGQVRALHKGTEPPTVSRKATTSLRQTLKSGR
jgi:MFS family permease